MAAEEGVEEMSVERIGVNVGGAVPPPIRRGFSVMETDAAEEAGVAKNQSAFRLPKNEVIVLFRAEIRRFDAEFAGHPEMKADPVACREFEQHLFSPRFGAEKSAAGELANDGARIRSTKNPLLAVELNPLDFLPEPGVPLSAVKFDFGELGHGEKML